MSDANAAGHDGAPSALRARVPRANSMHDRRKNERRERVRDEAGNRAPRAEEEEGDSRAEATARRPAECRRQALERGAPPCDQRPDPHEEQERQPERAEEEVVVRAPENDRLAAHRLREHRIHDAPEDREAEREQEQVVVEERSLARDRRLELRRRAELRQPPEHEPEGHRHGERDEREEPWSDRALREGVDRVDDTRAREERPEQREREREDHEQDVPDLQHPALLLDHHRVQERRRREPRHERGVLDGIPRVVPAPSDLDVRPVAAEELADPERRPREERPAPRGDQPALVELPREQCADRERERHREPDVAEVEERRMGEHVRVLEARRHPGAVRRSRLRRERARDGDEEEREERRHGGEDGHDPHDQVARPRAVQAHGSGPEAGEDQQPEQERSLLAAPERGDRVRGRQRPARRPRDVLEREVVAQERRDEDDGGDGRRDERRHERVLRRAREPAATEVRSRRARDERVDGQAECDEERGATQLRHGRRSGGAALLRRVLRRALRDHRAGLGDERALLELTVDDDVPTDLEEVGNGSRVENGDRCPAVAADVLEPEAKAAGVRVASHRPDDETGELNVPVRPASSLGASDGFPPPAIDVYRRKTASTAATDSAMTSRAGLAFRASGKSSPVSSVRLRAGAYAARSAGSRSARSWSVNRRSGIR